MSNQHGTAFDTSDYSLGQYNQVLNAITLALPKALYRTNARQIIKSVGEGVRLQQLLADLFEKVVNEEPRIFNIDVEYSKLAAVLARYDSVGEALTGDRFGTKRTGLKTIEILLIPFKECPEPKPALSWVEELGYRGAEAVEILTWGLLIPETVRKKLDGMIVGLGSSYYDPTIGTDLYPVIHRDTHQDSKLSAGVILGEDRDESCIWDVSNWPIYYAAVRELE